MTNRPDYNGMSKSGLIHLVTSVIREKSVIESELTRCQLLIDALEKVDQLRQERDRIGFYIINDLEAEYQHLDLEKWKDLGREIIDLSLKCKMLKSVKSLQVVCESNRCNQQQEVIARWSDESDRSRPTTLNQTNLVEKNGTKPVLADCSQHCSKGFGAVGLPSQKASSQIIGSNPTQRLKELRSTSCKLKNQKVEKRKQKDRKSSEKKLNYSLSKIDLNKDKKGQLEKRLRDGSSLRLIQLKDTRRQKSGEASEVGISRKRSRMICTYEGCAFVTLVKNVYQTHINNHKTYACQWPGCGFSFDDQLSLKNHMMSHSLKPYPCGWSSCQMRFSNIWNAILHRRNHKQQKVGRNASRPSNIRPFVCRWPECAYKTGSYKHLQQHREQAH